MKKKSIIKKELSYDHHIKTSMQTKTEQNKTPKSKNKSKQKRKEKRGDRVPNKSY